MANPYGMYPNLYGRQEAPAAGTGLGHDPVAPFDISALDDEAIAKMVEGGKAEQQLALLQKQMARAEAMRKPDEYTQGMGSGWGNAGIGIGNTLRIIGANMRQDDLQKQEQAQMGLMGGGAEALFKGARGKPLSKLFGMGGEAPSKLKLPRFSWDDSTDDNVRGREVQTMDDFPYELLSQDPTVVEKLKARSGALRGKEMYSAMAHMNPLTAGAGKQWGLESLQERKQLYDAPEQGQMAELRGEQVQRARDDNAAMSDPRVAKILTQALGQLGGKDFNFEGLPARTSEKLFGPMATIAARREAAQRGNEDREWRRTVQEDRVALAQEKAEATAAAAVRGALDPNGARAGNMGTAAKRVQVSGALRKLVEKPDGSGLNLMDSRQIYELARGLDAMLSAGAATISGTEHLIPSTFQGGLAQYWEKLKNEPQPGAQQEFVERMYETIVREQAYWDEQVKAMAKARLGSLKPQFQRYPDSTAAAMEEYGINAEDVPHHPYFKAKGQTSGGGNVNVPQEAPAQVPGSNPAKPPATVSPLRSKYGVPSDR